MRNAVILLLSLQRKRKLSFNTRCYSWFPFKPLPGSKVPAKNTEGTGPLPAPNASKTLLEAAMTLSDEKQQEQQSSTLSNDSSSKSSSSNRRRKRIIPRNLNIPNIFTKDPESKNSYDTVFPNLQKRIVWAADNQYCFDERKFPYSLDQVVWDELTGLAEGLLEGQKNIASGKSAKLTPIICLASPDYRAGRMLERTGKTLARHLNGDICTLDVTDVGLVTRALMALNAGKASWEDVRDPEYLIERLAYYPSFTANELLDEEQTEDLEDDDATAAFVGAGLHRNDWLQYVPPVREECASKGSFLGGNFEEGNNNNLNLGHLMNRMLHNKEATNQTDIDLYTTLCYIFGAIRQAREGRTEKTDIPNEGSENPLTVIHLTGFENVLERTKDRNALVAFAKQSAEYAQRRGERFLILLNEFTATNNAKGPSSDALTAVDELNDTTRKITTSLSTVNDPSVPRQYSLYQEMKRMAQQQSTMTVVQENHIDWLIARKFTSLRCCILLRRTRENEQQLAKDQADRLFGLNYWRILDVMGQLGISIDGLPARENWLDILDEPPSMTTALPTVLCDGPLDLPEAICIAHLAASEFSKQGISLESLWNACNIFSRARQYQSVHFNGTGTSRSISLAVASSTHNQKSPLDPKLLTKHEKRFIPCIVTPDMVKTRFNDIAALDRVKRTLHELISLPLERPEWFRSGILREAVSGILLFGPPGTGKTMLAKAVAAQSGSNFISVTSSSIYDMYVGEGEKNAKALFTLARKIAPCVIFVDEVDALMDSRANSLGRASRVEVLNEFMSEWDGLLSQQNTGIIVMAATNRPFALDDAVLRRLPRRILVDLPDPAGRTAILKLLLGQDSLGEDVSLERLGALTDSYSGSDLKNLCIAAGMAALRDMPPGQDRPVIRWGHLEGAMSDVPASISDRMETIAELRRWDQQFGEGRKRTASASGMGFYPKQL